MVARLVEGAGASSDELCVSIVMSTPSPSIPRNADVCPRSQGIPISPPRGRRPSRYGTLSRMTAKTAPGRLRASASGALLCFMPSPRAQSSGGRSGSPSPRVRHVSRSAVPSTSCCRSSRGMTNRATSPTAGRAGPARHKRRARRDPVGLIAGERAATGVPGLAAFSASAWSDR